MIRFQVPFLVLLYVFLLTSFWKEVSVCAEADYFTRRNRSELKDLAEPLEVKIDNLMVKAAGFARGCNEASLREEMYGQLGGLEAERLAKEQLERLDAKRVPYGQSIYGATPSLLPQHFCTDSLFRLGDKIVSSDKLSHFFHTGYEMSLFVEKRYGPPTGASSASFFSNGGERAQTRFTGMSIITLQTTGGAPREQHVGSANERDDYVMELSHKQEEGNYGKALTGVKSYGDIAANFEGFKFWQSLTSGPAPYFKCVDNKWVKVRSFKWNEYASHAWDEGINCNEYTDELKDKITSRIIRATSRDDAPPPHNCPLEPRSCEELATRYGRLADRILHPNCRQVLSGTLFIRDGHAVRAVP